jgi:hypothetical protein
MPVLLRRLAALTTLLLALAIIVILSLRGMGVAVAIGPFSSATPIATPSPTATASASGSPSAQAVFSEIEAQVRQLRGLAAPSLAPPQLITRAQLAAELRQRFDRDYPPARRASDNVLLHALGMLAPKQDVGELQLKLLSGQVIGFYDSRSKRMVLVSDSGLDATARMTYAHEYTHALQDKAFGLSALDLQAIGQDDRDLARLALVEGDATTVMFQWALDHLTLEQLEGIAQTPIPDLAGIPPWMVEQLQFPYTAGAQLVSRLQASGGWSAVDAAFKDPPASSEQVIDYDKYVAHEVPDHVAAPKVAAVLGTGWRESPADTLGEEMVALWLQSLGVSQADAASAAEGWGGDRVIAASGPNSNLAVAWRMTWDAPGDATQFGFAYRSAATAAHLRSRLVSLSDHETLVIQASTQAEVDALAAAAR